MTPRLITSKFAGKCAKCRSPFDAGAAVYYDKDAAKGYKSWHAECNSAPAAPQETPAPSHQPASANAPTAIVAHRLSPYTVHGGHYDSVSAFCALETSPINAAVWNQYLTDDRGMHWFGVDGSMRAAFAVIKEGWHDGLRKVEENLDDITAPPTRGLRRRVVRGDHGSEFDIHRVYAGDFENAWSRRERRNAAFGHAQKTILVTISANGLTGSEQLFWRGAACIKVADALLAAGYGVEIVALISSERVTDDEKHSHMATFNIKPFDMPLDRLELATVTCFAGFWRSHGFKSRLSLPVKIQSNLGYSCDAIPERYKNADTIRGLDGVNSLTTAQDFINRTIRSLTHEDQDAA